LGALASLFLIHFIYHFDKSTAENWFKTADVAVPLFCGILAAILAFWFFNQLEAGFCRRLINNDMQNKHFLQTLYDGTRHLGLVKSQYEFGYICGKKESWLSCAKSVDRAMPLDAMVILAVSLENMIPLRLPKSRQSEAKKLVRGLWDIIRAKASMNE
jgi:hypothetical protein